MLRQRQTLAETTSAEPVKSWANGQSTSPSISDGTADEINFTFRAMNSDLYEHEIANIDEFAV